ncbi:MAG TPA: class I SAM-dependent DNA methyltransferase [Phycisphaerae bacterium]|nr:class I SAM-dependent DNA methyltransferase [Phycisphaerae bacterium]
MNVQAFIAKWRKMELTERSASQQHFLDLCELCDHPKPAEVDATGESFTFERGAAKQDGGDGWADVWKRGFFGWEYKGKHKDLGAAYGQLLQYREALENPPILVVCDMDRIEIHTNFTNTPPVVHSISLEKLGDPRSLEILRAVFRAPEKLRPGTTSEAITAEVAERLAEVAQSLRARSLDAHQVAHYLDRVVFCLFAEDIGLLPEGLFTRMLDKAGADPVRFSKLVGQLFDAMATGGDFGMETIKHFNGNLFSEGPVLELTAGEVEKVRMASKLDWSAVDPSVLGTLFERGMDPAKRSQLGAHYTSRQDIEMVVEPVVMQPLRREWAEAKGLVENLLSTGKKNPTGKEKAPSAAILRRARGEAQTLVDRFLHRLQTVKVLDSACGSGNFLYVTLQKLKDLEKEVILYAGDRGLAPSLPLVGPWQLYGIEVSPYAFDLAQMTVWIGYLQWARQNGFGWPSEPVLRKMDSFKCMDAILDLSDPEKPKEPEWPAVDLIIGNPPFLGDKLMRGQLSDAYVEKLRSLYEGRVPGGADLCCYWFEKAREQIEKGKCRRAGLLATQGIRGGVNREVLKRIKETGDIFFAESDRPWVIDGANVHVSMVGFDNGEERARVLDGSPAPTINANLSSRADTTRANVLAANASLCYLGVMKAGPFDMTEQSAMAMLRAPNPHGRANSDVLRPRLTAKDILQRADCGWIVDFGCEAKKEEACLYQAPWEHLERTVKPVRIGNRRKRLADKWWIHGESRPGLRESLKGLPRFIVTPEVSKHRIFAWLDSVFLADHQTRAFGRADDYFFGVLHSRLHEVWALAQGTQLREKESGFRYTPTTCFETFPFPSPTDAQKAAIAAAAKELDTLRQNWLNPPDWIREEVLEFPGSTAGPWARFVVGPDARGVGTIRYPRQVAKDDKAAVDLRKRTLTALYNTRPEWLKNAHRRLDEAVFAAYGWPAGLSDEEILVKLLEMNLAAK